MKIHPPALVGAVMVLFVFFIGVRFAFNPCISYVRNMSGFGVPGCRSSLFRCLYQISEIRPKWSLSRSWYLGNVCKQFVTSWSCYKDRWRVCRMMVSEEVSCVCWWSAVLGTHCSFFGCLVLFLIVLYTSVFVVTVVFVLSCNLAIRHELRHWPYSMEQSPSWEAKTS
jgi:hypothetical protein